jgi:hypothetical protein
MPPWRPAPSLKLLRSPDFQRGQGRADTFRGKRWEIAARLGRMARRAGHAADAVLRCCAQAREGGSEGDPTRSARKRPPIKMRPAPSLKLLRSPDFQREQGLAATSVATAQARASTNAATPPFRTIATEPRLPKRVDVALGGESGVSTGPAPLSKPPTISRFSRRLTSRSTVSREKTGICGLLRPDRKARSSCSR